METAVRNMEGKRDPEKGQEFLNLKTIDIWGR